jgi:hypothetical protein
MTPEDIAAAKAVKEVLGIYDGPYRSEGNGENKPTDENPPKEASKEPPKEAS